MLRPALSLLGPAVLAGADALLVNGVTPSKELWFSLAAAGALLLRRRWPVPVLLVALLGLYIGFIWFAPLIALYTVARYRGGRRTLAGCALLFALAYFVPNPADDLFQSPVREILLDIADTGVVIAAPIAIGLLVAARGRENELLAERVLSTERARLAREMHDVVAHQVSLISLQAGALRISTGDPAAKETAGTIRALSIATLDELRHLVGVLRAAGGSAQQLSPQPRLADLPRLIADSGLEVDLDVGFAADSAMLDAVPEESRYPEAVERAAFRTVQESLTNIRKHAPGATVQVRLWEADDRLHVEVSNGPAARDAEAMRLPGGGHGLVGLRERAQQLGGGCTAGPTDDGGFRVQAQLPVQSTGRSGD
ncbi:sensor histidine kinase [Streptomyces gobiensis]|uniref:sensor histidine kinase n=1 Tax=Streptomyces gobiensis TaxID=2875706 RepID=UPI001E445C7D|nr:histidine kinase [Streptomyces gobiensis]UGY92699.1 histidine kinase [Streptomyces gobiensis]